MTCKYSQLTRMAAKQSPSVFYVPTVYHMAPRLLREGVGFKRQVACSKSAP